MLHPLTQKLLHWYERHARNLPWRLSPKERTLGTKPNPYHIWLSEIMLQQTTVQAVKPYFAHFIKQWPTFYDLANAKPETLKAAWAGLGYYRRADNLHKTAKIIAAQNGLFPRNPQELKALPGIGDYTAAAIASIAFNVPAVVIDGNVERVITRLKALNTPLPKAKADIHTALEPLVPHDRPGEFAEAMMDLGATLCTPKKPACSLCPWSEECLANQQGTQALFPVKGEKKAKPLRNGIAYIIRRKSDGALLLRRRLSKGLLAGMVEVPGSNWSAQEDGHDIDPPIPCSWKKAGYAEHVFTHFRLMLEIRSGQAEQENLPDGFWWQQSDTLHEAGLPTVMLKALAVGIPDIQIMRPASSDLL
jgi:A/G-specific adenine glycosylase